VPVDDLELITQETPNQIPEMPPSEPPISVVICTRNRPDGVAKAMASVLHATSKFDTLTVVDQSTDELTKCIVDGFSSDSRVHYIRTDTIGLGKARNIALSLVHTDIIAFTDDDCTVAPNWLDAHRNIFAQHPKVVITYGSVVAADHDKAKGYIPAYLPRNDIHVRTFRDKKLARGIGANTAIRRTPILELGGYDPTMGAGGKFFGCEDGDMTLRCLASGREVYECRNSEVLHFGYRDWESGRRNTMNDWIGIGASCSKQLKLGRLDSLHVLYEEGFNRALLPFLIALMTVRPPFGWQRVVGFSRGLIIGFRTPIDSSTSHFAVDHP
jgi:glycosyltransferase involved in cell wall biosynthesis